MTHRTLNITVNEKTEKSLDELRIYIDRFFTNHSDHFVRVGAHVMLTNDEKLAVYGINLAVELLESYGYIDHSEQPLERIGNLIPGSMEDE